MMQLEQKDYLSYMLRLWRSDAVASPRLPQWRASLESVQTHEHIGFSNLAELFMFLEQEVEEHGLSDRCRRHRD